MKIWEKYIELDDGSLKRRNPFCERCGRGVFMADHGEFWGCGKCGDRRAKRTRVT